MEQIDEYGDEDDNQEDVFADLLKVDAVENDSEDFATFNQTLNLNDFS